MKKNPGDIIILHKLTKNYDQMMCGSWDMVHDRCNYFSFWDTFCPFTPPPPPPCAFLLVEAIPSSGSHCLIDFMVFKDQLIAISRYLYTPCADQVY